MASTRNFSYPSSASPSCASSYSFTSTFTSVSSSPSSISSVSQKSSVNAMNGAKSTKSASATAVPKKIPRPLNSFLIYRKERAKQYAGLVATELSAKLAAAWKKETKQIREHYAHLADIAKKEHAIEFPDYKFTPAKRGTGKRALQLAAMANAASCVSSPSPAADTKLSAPKKTNSSASLPEFSDLSLTSTRSCRQVSRLPRHAPLVSPYPAVAGKRNSEGYAKPCSITTSQQGEHSPSLLFSSSPYHSHTLGASKIPDYPTPESPSDLSDLDAEGDDGSYSDQILLHLGQQQQQYADAAVASQGWLVEQITPHVVAQPIATFAEPLTMESFEPECLAQHDSSLWVAATSVSADIASSPTASMMRQLYEQYQQGVLLSHQPSPTQSNGDVNVATCHQQFHNHQEPYLHQQQHSQQHMNVDQGKVTASVFASQDTTGCNNANTSSSSSDSAIHFSMEMDKLQRDLTSLLPSPVSTPLHHPYTTLSFSSQGFMQDGSSPSLVTIGTHQFVIPPLIQDDIMMSPALSTCSSTSSFGVGGVHQDVQSYFAQGLEKL
ncbi:Casanova [Podila humilis]|nr:Casanova [Podila humilis]